MVTGNLTHAAFYKICASRLLSQPEKANEKDPKQPKCENETKTGKGLGRLGGGKITHSSIWVALVESDNDALKTVLYVRKQMLFR